ncbi:hypothetical protein ECE50_020695 [Chitinophaga sp. Mgbs1]|uniref:Uncharacterized protein n=1 Tax=Chitinophaga solisilvae TaxID=1233460 RepID=A0A3S1B230_9BACT|nr:hypothetical protein [Chitinophaga solisilvae]
MIIVKVTYTVKASFARQNQQNIDAALQEVRALNNPDIRYSALIGEDGKTFTHLAIFKNATAQQLLLNLPVFKSFQQQRDDSGLETAPQIEVMQLASSSYDIFN